MLDVILIIFFDIVIGTYIFYKYQEYKLIRRINEDTHEDTNEDCSFIKYMLGYDNI